MMGTVMPETGGQGMYYADYDRLRLFGVTNLRQEELAAPEVFPSGSMSQFLDCEYDENGSMLEITYYADSRVVWRE